MSTEQIGKINTTLTIVNRADRSAATRGYISSEQVQTLTLKNVLIGTGAKPILSKIPSFLERLC